MPLLSANSLHSFSSLFPSILTNNPFYNNQTSRTLLFTLGAGVFLSKLFNLIKGVISLFPIAKDLAARYGKGTWAVVTGAGGDGIGSGFALELARRGFNIVLVSHPEDKLESAAQEIKTRYPGIQTRIIYADFTDSYKEGFAENLYEQVKDLDISILVNNAGVALGQKLYLEAEIPDIRRLILVNSLSHALITRALLPHLAKRTQRSAIITVGSVLSDVPMPRIQTYGASKAFLNYLTRGLAYEHPNIDVLSFRPGIVSTKMTVYRKPDFETLSVEECVNSALSALGNTDHTFGHWKHKRFHFKLTGMPEFMLKAFLSKRARPQSQTK